MGVQHHFGAGDVGGARGHLAVLLNEQDLVDVDRGAFGLMEQLEVQGLAFRDPILLTAGFNNRVNGSSPRRG